MIKIKAVEMVRRIRDELHEKTLDKSREEFEAFIQHEAANAQVRQQRQRQKQQQQSLK